MVGGDQYADKYATHLYQCHCSMGAMVGAIDDVCGFAVAVYSV